MALVRGKEVFAQVVVEAGEDSINRRMHRLEIHMPGKTPLVFEGNRLPHLAYINTTKNAKGQHVMRIDAAPKRGKKEFSPTTLFLALISFIGLCAYVIVAAISAHRCL
ncbi:hypothetical protein N9L06_00350 [Mariniblastus sp.]|nr:hypothetical protein [Mariniblastus sp.]